jgi:hypothetical protein
MAAQQQGGGVPPGHPTENWKKLSTRFYRKKEIYSMLWSVDLAMCYVEGAKFGGPLGIDFLFLS